MSILSFQASPWSLRTLKPNSNIILYLACVILCLSFINFTISKELENEVLTTTPSYPQNEAIHSRKKRFVYINVYSPVDIGFLIVVPYSFALPTFNLQTSRRKKKSVSLEEELLANLTSEEIFPSDSYDEPAYAIETRKIASYFTTLKIDEDICQQKIICEIFSDADSFHPLSGILSKNLIADHGPIVETNSSRYFRYIRAMQEGVSGGNSKCQKEYHRCPYSSQDRLNMPALHFWNFLTNLLSMEFKD